MIEFSAKDASILASVAQYERVPAATRRAILDEADRDETRIVGRMLIGDDVDATDDVRDAVAAVQNWVRQNRTIHEAKMPVKITPLEFASPGVRSVG